jgi:hypothetical protein
MIDTQKIHGKDYAIQHKQAYYGPSRVLKSQLLCILG